MSMQNSNKTIWWVLGAIVVIVILFFVFRNRATDDANPAGIPNTGTELNATSADTTTPVDPNAKG